ncbi:MAG: hypothetical protein H9901_00535 [Candidatus Paralactobacillus gallistercoris]|uniref:Uncharacterized protein n=1 Tax=Candidatus Paralactobacillus gallistercoris TaxID=2838724 RepID=A0A948TID7_9LACO|nr:hypothetical protein [Candidatus Paralactobacillus gallistercoris]
MRQHNFVFLISAFLLLLISLFFIITSIFNWWNYGYNQLPQALMGIVALVAAIIFGFLGWHNK